MKMKNTFQFFISFVVSTQFSKSETFHTFIFNITDFEPFYFQCGTGRCRGILQYCEEGTICQNCNRDICEFGKGIGQCQIMCRYMGYPEGVEIAKESSAECPGNSSDIWSILTIVLTVVLSTLILGILVFVCWRRCLPMKGKKEAAIVLYTRRDPITAITTDHHLTNPMATSPTDDQQEEYETGVKTCP